MFGVYTSVFLFVLTLSKSVLSSPCVAFDINNNLLTFGLGGKDLNAGTQDTWSSSTSATDITASGRPPFTGSNTTCYLAQFFNAIYVLNGDSSSPSSIYIYDATAKSWSKQSVTTGNFDPTSFKAVLDHDTNVFYAISHGELYSLDMGTMTSASGNAISWNDVEKPPFTTNGNDPVMALAQNHIHFLDLQNVPAGQAQIYVIHYDYFQPELQSYPSAGGGSPFPAIHGQASSFFQPTGVQQEFAFIPDDFSGTYVVNVETNTTTVLPPPASKDTAAFYFAGITSLVQLDSTGAVSYLPYQQGSVTTNAVVSWSTVKAIAASVPPVSNSSGSSSGKVTRTSTSTKPSGTTISGQNSSGATPTMRMSDLILVAICFITITGLL